MDVDELPNEPESAGSASRTPLSRLISTALLLGSLLLLLHAGLRLVFDPRLLASDAGRAAIRVSRSIVPAATHAFGTAAAATLLFALAFGPRRRAGVAGFFLFALVLLAFTVALLGVPWAQPALEPSGPAGRTMLLLSAAFPAGLAVWWLRARVRGIRPGWVLPAAAVAGLVVFALWRIPSWRPAHIDRWAVVRQVLADQDSWEVIRSHPAVGPRAGVLCPSRDPSMDGADRPALVLSPPSELRLRITKEDGPCLLRTAAGVSYLVEEFLLEGDRALRVEFEVQVNGEQRFLEQIEVRKDSGREGSEWRPVGGDQGLFLRPGDDVVLRTSLHREDGSEWITTKPVPAGFREMLLERRVPVPREPSSPERPNIVFVLQDTLRRDRLSCYGYSRPTSPQVDRLAAAGAVFDQAYATSSWTWPSTASIFTGRLPEDHGVVDDSSPFLDHEFETLAEALQAGGFTTAAFSGNPLVSPGKNFGQGFESFVSNTRGFKKSDELLPPALDWMRANSGTRFFLYLHLVDVHEPHEPLPEALDVVGRTAPEDFRDSHFNQYTRELLHKRGHTADGASEPTRVLSEEHAAWISDLYDASVWTGDHYLGLVLDSLEELGLADETLVVFTSDHGEELLDHGLYAHGQSVHAELVQVPLIVAGPGVPAGLRVDVPVSNRHLAPSLARAAGVSPIGPDDALDLFAFEDVASRPVFFSTTHGWWNGWNRTPIRGVRVGDWSLHYAPEAGPFGDFLAPKGLEERLYDLANDPGETLDRSPDRPFFSERLRAAVEAHHDQLVRSSEAPVLGAGEATMDLLRRIGYAGDEVDELDD